MFLVRNVDIGGLYLASPRVASRRFQKLSRKRPLHWYLVLLLLYRLDDSGDLGLRNWLRMYIDEAGQELDQTAPPNEVLDGRTEGARASVVPGLTIDVMRTTNRPTIRRSIWNTLSLPSLIHSFLS